MPNQFTGLPPSKKYAASHIAARRIIEKELGRKLNRKEHVHHIDGDFTNNSLDNLQVMTASEHLSYHQKLEQKALYPICKEIKRLYESGFTQIEIARLMGIAQQTVSLRLQLLQRYEKQYGK